MYNPFSLQGKSILITGAGSGIGRATAVECSKMGASCVLVGRDRSKLEGTNKIIDNSKTIIIDADLSTQDGRDWVVSNCPKLDGLVNNAAIGSTAPIQFISATETERIFLNNTLAPILLTQSLIKNRLFNKEASLVFVSSTDVFKPELANSIYASSKAAVTTFMRSCAKELAMQKIRANAIMPGMTETPFLYNSLISQEQLAEDALRYPLKRYGKPEEIAYSIIYLLSNATSWMTGSVICIDGGFSLI